MKRLSADWVYSQACFVSRAARLASGGNGGLRGQGVPIALRLTGAICATAIFASE
jgi:hypothetical protein